ncbi:Hypothetical Protein FCC1311_033862 [Hondaea fermentalgiana]|uniref:Uncharacterized protein n=1 Tax=Hondaea fermentalgiana TaxID=2315210 RepID=A0A2R5GEY5_9STRA|nr:Hypothetical Protein FCC1311_033862 [Hondaea fermentalgiana]|eukprot:GBG27163.1 Hypothetical Protein FCC1311_033862 [Hondaea fermentalgiana]
MALEAKAEAALDVYETKACVEKLRAVADKELTTQLKSLVQHCLGLVSVQRWLRSVTDQNWRVSVESVVAFILKFVNQELLPALHSGDAHADADAGLADFRKTMAELETPKSLARGSLRLLVRDELPGALASQFVGFIETADTLAHTWASVGAREAVLELIEENEASIESLLQNLQRISRAHKRKRSQDEEETNPSSKVARTSGGSCRDEDNAGPGCRPPRDDDDDNDEPGNADRTIHGPGYVSGSASGPDTANTQGAGGASTTSSNGNSNGKAGSDGQGSQQQDATKKSADSGPLLTMSALDHNLERGAAHSVIQLVHTMRMAIEDSPSLKRGLKDTAIVIESAGHNPGPAEANSAGQLLASSQVPHAQKRAKASGGGTMTLQQQQQVQQHQAALGVLGSLVTRNEVVIIKVIHVKDAKPAQVFEHVLDGEPRFVFRSTPALGAGRRLFARLEVDPHLPTSALKLEYVLAVRVGNSDFVQSMPFNVIPSTFDDDWVGANDKRKTLVHQFARVYSNQIAMAENRFLACQPVIMPDRDVLSDLKENVLRLEKQYEARSSHAARGSPGPEIASGQGSLDPQNETNKPGEPGRKTAQTGEPPSHPTGSPGGQEPNLNELIPGLGLAPPMNLSYMLPALSGLGSPTEQYNALLGSLGGLQYQVASGAAGSSAGKQATSPQPPGEAGSLKLGRDEMQGARRNAGFVTTASAANPQNLVNIRRDVEERLYRVVDFLRQSDKAPTAPLDDRHAQMFTWNENMALLLCSLLQESCKNPFKSILRNFNRAVTDGAAFGPGGAAQASRRPVRDRSSLRKRLQKMLHREQLSKDWESTRRASANLFVNSSKKRLEDEVDANLEFLREPVSLVEEVFVDLNPSVPAIGLN